MSVRILLGFSEERFEVPIFHTFFDATSGHRKTLAMHSIIQRFAEEHPDLKASFQKKRSRLKYEF